MTEKIPNPNYTQVPNCLLDSMADFTHTEFKVLMFVSRMTFGFHKDDHRMSYSYIEGKTGLARDTICNAIQTLLAKGVLVRVDFGNTFKYSLNLELVGESNQSEIPTETVRDSNQQIVRESDTYKETISKQTSKQKNTPPKSSSPLILPPTLDTADFKVAWMDWVEHRKQLKKKLTPKSIEKQIEMLERIGEKKAILAIENSIKHGWQGLFEPNQTPPSVQSQSWRPPSHIPDATYDSSKDSQ